MRYVVDLIRGKNVEEALNILRYCPKRGAYFAIKLLKSAVQNATVLSREKGLSVDFTKLCLVDAQVNQGPVLKRLRHSSMRRPVIIKKRTSHVVFALEERELPVPKKKKAKR
jgi:large subunit ribosomal protein L22